MPADQPGGLGLDRLRWSWRRVRRRSMRRHDAGIAAELHGRRSGVEGAGACPSSRPGCRLPLELAAF
jgi:hypothetical protein